MSSKAERRKQEIYGVWRLFGFDGIDKGLREREREREDKCTGKGKDDG